MKDAYIDASLKKYEGANKSSQLEIVSAFPFCEDQENEKKEKEKKEQRAEFEKQEFFTQTHFPTFAKFFEPKEAKIRQHWFLSKFITVSCNKKNMRNFPE